MLDKARTDVKMHNSLTILRYGLYPLLRYIVPTDVQKNQTGHLPSDEQSCFQA